MVMSGRELVESLRPQVQEIDVHALHALLKENPYALVIDIREKQETEVACIPNALLIPRGILEMQITANPSVSERFVVHKTLPEQPIYLLCRSGARSVLSAYSLQQMGFKDVYSVAGGFLAWQAAGYER